MDRGSRHSSGRSGRVAAGPVRRAGRRIAGRSKSQEWRHDGVWAANLSRNDCYFLELGPWSMDSVGSRSQTSHTTLGQPASNMQVVHSPNSPVFDLDLRTCRIHVSARPMHTAVPCVPLVDLGPLFVRLVRACAMAEVRLRRDSISAFFDFRLSS